MFHNPLDYFLSVRLKIFIFQILQLGRTPNEFRHKPIPSPKEFWMILLHWILSDGEKRHKKTCIANSQYLKRTQKHIIYSIFIFFFSQVCGVLRGFFYPSFFSMFFWNFIGLFLHNRVSYTYFIFYLPWFWYFLFNRKTTMAMTTTKTTTAMQSPIIMIKVSLLVEVFVAEK